MGLKMISSRLKGLHRGHQGFHRFLPKKKAVRPLHDAIDRAPFPIGDDRTARRVRFQGDDSKIFFPRKDQGPTSAVMLGEFFVIQPSQKAHISMRHIPQGIQERPGTHNF